MLLSDRDILAAQADGHISLDPWTPEMVQPASIDVRLDRFFRLFNNHAYTYVDPAENQGELTEQFEVKSDEPWILHPGEFALGSTWEARARWAVLASSPIPPRASSTRVSKATSRWNCPTCPRCR